MTTEIKSARPFSCRLCGRVGSELNGAYLTRVNETGVPAIWECHPRCDSTLTQEELLLMAIERG